MFDSWPIHYLLLLPAIKHISYRFVTNEISYQSITYMFDSWPTHYQLSQTAIKHMIHRFATSETIHKFMNHMFNRGHKIVSSIN